MNAALTGFLIAWQFWALAVLFALVIVTTVVEGPRLQVQRSTLIAAALLAVLAWTLTWSLAPRTSRIYYDEQIYQGIGRVMSDLHRAEMCNEGNVEYGRLQCWRGEYNKEPYGFPYLLSVVYSTTGVSDTAAFRFNNIVAGLTVFVTVILVSLLGGSMWSAALGGLLMALMPLQLTWSNTAAAEPSAALFSGASILAAVHFARRRTTSALAWTIALSAFAITIRPEGILILPLVLLTIALLAPGEFRSARLWWGGVAGLVLTSVPLLHLIAVRNETWGTTGSRLSWQYAVANAPVNVWFYLGDERFPIFVTAAAMVGLIAAGRRERLLMLLYFLTFWTVFVFFYAGSYNYGADVRYSLMTYIPIAVLGGIGLGHAGAMLKARWLAHWSERAVSGAIAAAVVLQFLLYAPIVRAVGEEAWAARADVKYAKQFAGALPPNSIVLTHNPGMFHIWGVSAAQLSLAKTDTPYVDSQLFSRYAGGVYLHWNFWCNVDDPVQVAYCRDALDQFPHELVSTARERNYQYTLYRLQKRPAK